jgi:ATP-dependent Clp protease ATP-binding subunit ClpC
MLKEVSSRLKNMDITLTADKGVKEYLANKGYDKAFGARPLRRTIQNLVEDKLAEEMLDGNIKEGDRVKIVVEDEKLKFIKQQEKEQDKEQKDEIQQV